MGKITKIEAQKRNKERVNIYIDEAYAFPLSMELVYKEGLKIGIEVNEEILSKVSREDDISKCKNTALKIIERSYKTEKEMVSKLIEKGYETEAINKAIEFLREYNFLNDEAYTKMYVKDRIRAQGKNKIKYALIRKGINEEIIREALSEVEDDEEKNRAIELAQKKYMQLVKRENDKYKLWNKLTMFLVGKGYDYSIAKDVIKSIVEVEEY